MAAEKQYRQALVKTVNSGDSISLIVDRRNRMEVNFFFSSVSAPKIAKRPRDTAPASNDEPFAWEAREFLRQLVVGKVVYYTQDVKPKEGGAPDKLFGTIYYPNKEDSVTELMVAEGLLTVRQGNPVLKELEEKAKSKGKGIHDPNGEASAHIRDIKWDPEPKFLIDKFGRKPMKAVIESISPKLTLRALILPDHYYVAVVFAGLKIAKEEYERDILEFLEDRILHRDVRIILESIQSEKARILNATIIHEARDVNIGELLVEEGYAGCNTVLSGITDDKKLREAEKKAQKERKRKWKNYVPKAPLKEKTATVLEIINGDALMVKYGHDGKEEKIFLSSIRPPRLEATNDGQPVQRGKQLFDVPWLFEAREFLRTRLIGKKVTITEDYAQPARDNYPEKKCCSVFVGGENIAEALVSKGLATCIKHREDEENKSPHYEKLAQAEEKATKNLVGVHAKKDIPVHRVNDVSMNKDRAKGMFPSLQRMSSLEGVVEFVASGSRFRIFIEKEAILITFLLAGIDCPRASRPAGPNTKDRIPSEEFGDEALEHVKKIVLQRNVELKIESMDKRGGMIGWMFVNGVNISQELVEQGFARVHETADKFMYASVLKRAEENAKNAKLRRWANWTGEEETNKENEIRDDSDVKSDRKISYIEACIVVIDENLTVYAQNVSDGNAIDNLMSRLRQEFTAYTPVAGSYHPRKNDICAAKFKLDGCWYRAKVERVSGDKADVLFIDYGDRQTVDFKDLATLPDSLKKEPAYAHEYKLALVKQPPEDYRPDSLYKLREELVNKNCLINVEYSIAQAQYVTICDARTKEDIIKDIIAGGYYFVDNRRDRRLQKLIQEYEKAQEEAKKNRLNIWEFGDLTGYDERQNF